MNILNKIFDLFFYFFQNINPFWGLAAISAITGILMLIIFKYTSNQEAIKRTKDKIKAHLLEFRLYKDDFGLTMAAQKKMLRQNLTYMKHALKPMLVMIVPVVLILIQLDMRYSYRSLKPGESTIVNLKLSDGNLLTANDVSLNVPEQVEVETYVRRMGEHAEVDWKIKPKARGIFELEFQVSDQRFSKQLIVENKKARFSPFSSRPTFLETIFNPAEPHLPKDSMIESIEIKYPEQSVNVFGWNIHWLIVFFILSIIFGFAMKGFLGIEV